MRTTRRKGFGGWVAAAVAAGALLLPGVGPGRASAQVSDYAVPGTADYNVPIPTGKAGDNGFYTFGELLILTQTRELGVQTVATRGLVDTRGLITGSPGTYIGSGNVALSTGDFTRRDWSPGFTVGAGYKFDGGVSVYGSYTHVIGNNLHAGATLATPYAQNRPDLADSFLFSPVFNFPPQFAGPRFKTAQDDTNGNGTLQANEGGNFYGIWNGASVMDIQFNQWFNAAEIGARVPLFQTEYSRIYGLAGGRYTQFMERFTWRTVSYDVTGFASPLDAAIYNNTLSQRLYGPFVGCGHEAYIGNSLSVSVDATAALLLGIAKERAKYRIQDNIIAPIQNKLSRNDFELVPNVNTSINLMWYPIEGVQMRVGYSAMMYFNTQYMQEPISFNYSSIDPAYNNGQFRILHGVNIGLGVFF
jgi:hypothetical protein